MLDRAISLRPPADDRIRICRIGLDVRGRFGIGLLVRRNLLVVGRLKLLVGHFGDFRLDVGLKGVRLIPAEHHVVHVLRRIAFGEQNQLGVRGALLIGIAAGVLQRILVVRLIGRIGLLGDFLLRHRKRQAALLELRRDHAVLQLGLHGILQDGIDRLGVDLVAHRGIDLRHIAVVTIEHGHDILRGQRAAIVFHQHGRERLGDLFPLLRDQRELVDVDQVAARQHQRQRQHQRRQLRKRTSHSNSSNLGLNSRLYYTLFTRFRKCKRENSGFQKARDGLNRRLFTVRPFLIQN